MSIESGGNRNPERERKETPHLVMENVRLGQQPNPEGQRYETALPIEPATQHFLSRLSTECGSTHLHFGDPQATTEPRITFQERPDGGQDIRLPFNPSPEELRVVSRQIFPGVTEREEADPIQLLQGALVEQGMKELVDNLGKDGWNEEAQRSLGLAPGEETKSLRELINVPHLKQHLVKVREEYKDDKYFIGAVEQMITETIQEVVSKIPYRVHFATPAQIIATQKINCAAATNIASTLLTEIGIDHVTGIVPKHEVLFIVTSNEGIYYHDFLSPRNNHEFLSETLQVQTNQGEPITMDDIVAVAHDPRHEGVMLNGVLSDEYRSLFLALAEGDPRNYLIFNHPQQGVESNIFASIGFKFLMEGRYKESLVAHQSLTRRDPENALYRTVSLIKLERFDEALRVTEQESQRYPDDPRFLTNKACVLSRMGRNEEAIITQRKAVEIWPQDILARKNLGEFYLTGEDHSAAEHVYQGILLEHEDDAKAHLGLAQALDGQKKADEARQHCDRALEHADPQKEQKLIASAQQLLIKLGI
jgi:hypothetical protein